MPDSLPTTLTLARRLLRALIALNVALGCLILALLITSLIATDWLLHAFGVPPTESNPSLILGMRLVMTIGLIGVPVTNAVLTRLLAIVSTVTDGDPFVAENATRLQQIAWAVLVLELLHVGVGIVAAHFLGTVAPKLRWDFSPTPWLGVLLLFVLARVFDHGTRMREELAGTV
jgi:hypothetical protein